MSGKWHVARQRNMAERDSWPDERPGFPLTRERGFDDFFGTIGGAGSYYKPTYLMRNEELLDQTEPDWYYTDQITDHGVRMATEAMDDELPFFLYLSYTAPHWPLHAHREDIAHYENHYRGGWDSIRTARHEELKSQGLVDPRWPISPRDPTAFPWEESTYPEWEAYRMAIYAAQIDRMDRGVGRLLEALRDRDQLDNTVIIFLSDNGGAAEFLAEDGPLRPGWIADTTPDGRPMHYGNTPDIRPGGPETFPELRHLLGETPPTPRSAVSRGGCTKAGSPPRSSSTGPPASPHPEWCKPRPTWWTSCPPVLRWPAPRTRHAFGATTSRPSWARAWCPPSMIPGWERPGSLFFEHEGYRAIRQGPWKLVSGEEERWELYQIDEDRIESTDLAGHEKLRVRRMAADWNDWAVRVGVNFNLRDDLQQLFGRERRGVEKGRARLRRAGVAPCG